MNKMIRLFAIFLLGVLCGGIAFAAYPNCRKNNPTEYTIDPREYVEWGDGKCPEPYDKLIQILSPRGRGWCTAQYVAPNIILTALHCVYDKKDDVVTTKNLTFKNCSGNEFTATVEQHGDLAQYKGTTDKGIRWGVLADWALLRIEDSKYFSNAYFLIDDETSQPTEEIFTIPGYWVDNPGWGGLSILSDKQIKDTRADMSAYIERKSGESYSVDKMQNKQVKNDSFSSFFQEYIYENNVSYLVSDDTPYLKVHKHCALWPHYQKTAAYDMNVTYCYSWGGNSGGAHYTSDNYLLRSIVSGGSYSLPNELGAVGVAVPTASIYKATLELMKKYPVDKSDSDVVSNDNPAVVVDTARIPVDGKADVIFGDSISGIEQEMEDVASDIVNKLQDVETMPDYDFLVLLGRMAEYQRLRERYEAAKAREQSLPNRLLGAAAIGATGIGGMELMSGLAEQRADENAERDMKAYLATFKCDYGAGRNIKGGETNIELPASSDMLSLVAQYKQIASNLKITKESLGMVAGIESEVIFDSATTGLYDNASLGTQAGAFTSVARALMDENSADAQKWAEQKEKAKSKTKTGAIVGGVGAAGGAVGNLIINKDNTQDKNLSDSR